MAQSRSTATVRTEFVLWVANGLFWFGLAVYVWGSWMLGPDFKANTLGVDQAPESYVLLVRTAEAISVLLAIFQLWHFVVKPKIRTGRFSFDGLFFLACLTLYLQEPWINYNNHQFLYTTVAYNMGSWVNYVPGWNSPNGDLIPVGSIIWATAYLNLVAFWAYSGSLFMRWLKSKRPGISNINLILATFAVFLPFDFVLEQTALALGLFNYSSTVPELTLWAGEPYQFPVYEMVLWCAALTGWSSVHFFRNDRGETYVERGIESIRFPSSGAKTFTRFVMMMGICQLYFLLLYNVPYFYWSTKGAAFPAYGEWRVAGVCGPQSKYDCPAADVPVPKRESPTNRIRLVDNDNNSIEVR
jgi:hypothetical protein